LRAGRLRHLLLPVVLVVALSVAHIALTAASTVNAKSGEAGVSLAVKVYGLATGDRAYMLTSVICVYGNSSMETETLGKYVINKSGTFMIGIPVEKLDYHNCTRTIISVVLASPEYGEVPEEYLIDLDSTARNVIEIRFYLGNVLASRTFSVVNEKLSREPIGIIGYLDIEGNKLVVKGIDSREGKGKAYFILTDIKPHTKNETSSKDNPVTIIRSLAEKRKKVLLIVEPSSNGIHRALIVDPAKPIWLITNRDNVAAYLGSCVTGYRLENYAHLSEVIAEVHLARVNEQREQPPSIALAAVSSGTSLPPCIELYEANVGGESKQIDVLGTPDGGEQFWNFNVWSFPPGSGVPKCIELSEKDRPLAIIFYGNAEVDKVKDIYWGISFHTDQCMRLRDGSDWEWDIDRGTHEGVVQKCGLHMRVYAPYPEDRFLSEYLGYFVIATAHYDCGEQYGYTEEDAEQMLLDIAKSKGYTVYPNLCPAYTADISTNDGNVSYVEVP
jgi:hypothetical protein